MTTPLVAAWDNQKPADSVVNGALLLAGLEPWPVSWWEDEENYLGQIGAVFVSEGRWTCEKHWCAGHWMEVDDEAWSGGSVFFVRLVMDTFLLRWLVWCVVLMADTLFVLQSFTNHSLYTSFQRAGCYFSNSWDNHLASIDPRYGLDGESEAESPEQFWSELKAHLHSLIKQHATRQGGYCRTPFTVLVAGEAADTAEFLDVLNDVVRDIPGLCGNKSRTAEEWEENDEAAKVELVIPDDLTYGAAKGAAIWLRTRMNWTYCADQGIIDQYDMVRDYQAGLRMNEE